MLTKGRLLRFYSEVGVSFRKNTSQEKEPSMPFDDFPKPNGGSPLGPQFPIGNKKDEPDVNETEVSDSEKSENAVNEMLENAKNKAVETTTIPSTTAECIHPQAISSGKDIEKSEGDGEVESKENGSSDKNEVQTQTMDEETKRKIVIGVSTAAAATLGAFITPYAVVGALGAIGFGAGGVAAGSIAAAIQSSVYGGAVASGSVFAICQSIGAAGLGFASAAASAVGGGGVSAGIAAALSSRFGNNKGAPGSDEKEQLPDKPKCDKKTQTSAFDNAVGGSNEKDEVVDISHLEISPREQKKSLL